MLALLSQSKTNKRLTVLADETLQFCSSQLSARRGSAHATIARHASR